MTKQDEYGFIIGRKYKLEGDTTNRVFTYKGSSVSECNCFMLRQASWVLIPEDSPSEDQKTLAAMQKMSYEKSDSRVFKSGASRNSDEGKLDFEGFLSPTVLKAYAEYMHSNRALEDGTLRDSDNWQKGIPIKAYMKSMYRHFFDTWSKYRGLETPETQKQNLCGLLFNTMGMLHELLKEEEVRKAATVTDN